MQTVLDHILYLIYQHFITDHLSRALNTFVTQYGQHIKCFKYIIALFSQISFYFYVHILILHKKCSFMC